MHDSTLFTFVEHYCTFINKAKGNINVLSRNEQVIVVSSLLNHLQTLQIFFNVLPADRL